MNNARTRTTQKGHVVTVQNAVVTTWTHFTQRFKILPSPLPPPNAHRVDVSLIIIREDGRYFHENYKLLFVMKTEIALRGLGTGFEYTT
jgi:hypothetical protein